MNNMRRGFTMIELIFVIVIIGILAAVAIPKLAGTANEAKKATINSFMGTLNRTVGPAMWAEVATSGGSVKTLTITDYTELPTGVSINLATCGTNDGNATNGLEGVSVGAVSTAALPNAEVIYCQDGSSTESPKFGFDDNLSTALKNN